MGYDGGLSIKVANPEMLKILMAYEKRGAFSDVVKNMIGNKYKGVLMAITYEYLDCAYIKRCPETLDDVMLYVYELINFYLEGEESKWDDLKGQFKQEIMMCNDEIIKGYTFVEWRLFEPDGINLKEKSFDYGKLEFKATKGRKKALSKTPDNESVISKRKNIFISEVFPDIGKSTDNRGLDLNDGVLTDIRVQEHKKYLGVGDFAIYIPADVREINEDTNAFNYPFDAFDSFTITNGLRTIPTYSFYCKGFKMFRIVDENSGKILFETDQFSSNDDFISNEESWLQFCDLYNSKKEWKRFFEVYKKADFDNMEGKERQALTLESMTSIQKVSPEKEASDSSKNSPSAPLPSKSFGKIEIFNVLLNDKNVKRIRIPDGTTNIDKSVCFRMTELQSVAIPASVQQIGESAFMGCSKLESVIFMDADESSPEAAVAEIAGYAFTCSITGTLNIPGRFKRIGRYAFSGNPFETVVLREGVTHIESYSFSDCKSLKQVFIPRSVAKIKDSAFARSKCAIYGVDGSYAHQFAAKRGMKFVAIDDVDWPAVEPVTVTIPPVEFHGRGTIRIPDGTISIEDEFIFINEEIQKLIIPSSLKRIGVMAFDNSQRLESVIFLDDDVTYTETDECEIGLSAFSDSGVCGKIIIPGRFKRIRSSAFKKTRLETVVLQEGVTYIDRDAFGHCHSLKRVYIPRSVKEMDWAFEECQCTIFAFEGSYTEQWVKELKEELGEECLIDFVAIDDADWPEA